MGVLLLFTAVAIFYPQNTWPFVVNLDDLIPPDGQYNVRILRDEWGVPHIFGQTDADAAYGLAFAHAEDDFGTIQDTALASRGMLGQVYGRDSAPIDYFVHLLRIWDDIDAQYETIPPETRAILEAYAAGLNHYAALHPDEVATPDLFPITGQDITAGFMLKVPVFFGLDSAVGKLFEPPEGNQRSEIGAWQLAMNNLQAPISAPYGSNVFAVSPARSANGETFLAVNSHQPWEGAAAWYEAHVRSAEGWDAVGGLLPGAPAIVLGHNRQLGWSFTVNHPDLVDIYELEINPDNPNQYKFDGAWRELETREITLRVKIIGRLVIPVKQTVWWSVYGPTVQQEWGTFAIRYAGMGEVGYAEQFLRLNKATNLAEWQAAMREGPLPMFNAGYADNQGNIYYVYNARLPLRAEGYDWQGILPGNPSETLWREYLPYDDLPQVLNPAAGFIQNANSTPYQTTPGPENPQEADYDPAFGIETALTNRALRALSLFGADDAITWEEFYAIKYDMAYDPASDMAQLAEMLAQNPPPGDETMQQAAQLLGEWDLQATPDSRATAVAVLTLNFLYESDQVELEPWRLVDSNIPLAAAQNSFRRAVDVLAQNFGRVDVPWQEVNRLIRGNVDVGLGGAPDVNHAIYGELQEDGRFRGIAGDSYVMLVMWDADGRLTSQSIHQYGSAATRPDSPHYADQSPLFAQRRLKPVWLDEADIRAHLEREYAPGD
ncbi:MAG TPA: acylase [Anaerolineae bacterium]|nr:acylase [Anaerolineae bacterium]